MQLLDSHCHIDLPVFKDDLPELLKSSRDSGVSEMILPGVCQSGWQNLLKLCAREPGLFPAIGLHPMYLNHHTPDHLRELAHHIASKPLVALGEIGLDYFVTGVDQQKQQELFEAQLQLAKINRLPILLHVRKAHDKVLATLRRHHLPNGGIVHAFSGSLQQAKQYIEMGFKISFCGTVTYDRAKKIRRLAQDLDLHDIVIETDAPDLPPARNHGERNVPANLFQVVECLATLRGQSKELIGQVTRKNGQQVLGLSELNFRPTPEF